MTDDKATRPTHPQLREYAASIDNERTRSARELYNQAAHDLLAQLHALGYPVTAVQELRWDYKKYKPAVPVLAAALPGIRYWPLKDDVTRSLAFAWAADAAPVLVKEFERRDYGLEECGRLSVEEANDEMRWVIGLALGAMLSPSSRAEVLRLAGDSKWGSGRATLVESLGKLKGDAEAASVVVAALSDPSPHVVQSAMKASARLRLSDAAPLVGQVLDRSEDWLVSDARKWLKRCEAGW